MVLWTATAAFAVRVCFEVVIADYYIWPVLAGGLILAGRKGSPQLLAFSAFAVLVTWFQESHWTGVWPWWLLTVVPMVIAVGLVLPEPPERIAPMGADAEADAGTYIARSSIDSD
jgi:hypothetical protein